MSSFAVFRYSATSGVEISVGVVGGGVTLDGLISGETGLAGHPSISCHNDSTARTQITLFRCRLRSEPPFIILIPCGSRAAAPS